MRVGVVIAGLILLLLPTCACGVDEDLSDQEVLAILSSEQPRDRSIRLALRWLREQQRPNGSLIEGRDNSMALTSLGIMAHLAAGVTFADREHGQWLQRSLRYVLSMQSPNGYFGDKDGSRMYGHGIAALMLAEALGMVGDVGLEEGIRQALERAVVITEHAARVKKKQPHQGGWRYHPGDDKSDLSLSGWQLMSLHACQQVGITVDEKVVREACAYARRLTTAEGKVGYDAPGEDHPALRGLSLLSFAVVGEEDDPLVDAVVDRMKAKPVAWQGPWLFYRLYYESVGMSRARPEQWRSYRSTLERVLTDHQHEDGWWPSPPGDNESRFGKVYLTSMAVLALTVERHVLPAYQR